MWQLINNPLKQNAQNKLADALSGSLIEDKLKCKTIASDSFKAIEPPVKKYNHTQARVT